MTRIVILNSIFVAILLEEVLLEKSCFISFTWLQFSREQKCSTKAKVNIFVYLKKPVLTFLKYIWYEILIYLSNAAIYFIFSILASVILFLAISLTGPKLEQILKDLMILICGNVQFFNLSHICYISFITCITFRNLCLDQLTKRWW